jgi:hypothetical protein
MITNESGLSHEAGRYGHTSLKRWVRSPGGRVEMFDKNLIHAIIGGKDLDCGLG